MIHSKIGASSYYRWKACPASVRLSEGVPRSESVYAAEGTKAHDIASELLEAYFFNKKIKNSIFKDTPPDMKPAVMMYVDYIKAEAKACNAKPEHILIENKFSLEEIHPALFGTSDATIYDEKNKILKVIDYKHGAGLAVDVKDNSQLLYYGLGALMALKVPCAKIQITIVQPRCDHPDGVIRSAEYTALELMDFAADLEEDAIATEKPDALVKEGSHCRFCP